MSKKYTPEELLGILWSNQDSMDTIYKQNFITMNNRINKQEDKILNLENTIAFLTHEISDLRYQLENQH